MRIRPVFVVFLALAATALSAPPTGAPGIAKASYYPVQWATIDALTTADIDGGFDITSCLQSQSGDIRKILRRAGKGRFDGSLVRLKVVFSDGVTVYMDRDGGVLWGKGTYALDRDGLMALFDVLHECLPPPPRQKSSPPSGPGK